MISVTDYSYLGRWNFLLNRPIADEGWIDEAEAQRRYYEYPDETTRYELDESTITGKSKPRQMATASSRSTTRASPRWRRSASAMFRSPIYGCPCRSSGNGRTSRSAAPAVSVVRARTSRRRWPRIMPSDRSQMTGLRSEKIALDAQVILRQRISIASLRVPRPESRTELDSSGSKERPHDR